MALTLDKILEVSVYTYGIWLIYSDYDSMKYDYVRYPWDKIKSNFDYSPRYCIEFDEALFFQFVLMDIVRHVGEFTQYV